jgi:hypothetical protein
VFFRNIQERILCHSERHGRVTSWRHRFTRLSMNKFWIYWLVLDEVHYTDLHCTCMNKLIINSCDGFVFSTDFNWHGELPKLRTSEFAEFRLQFASDIEYSVERRCAVVGSSVDIFVKFPLHCCTPSGSVQCITKEQFLWFFEFSLRNTCPKEVAVKFNWVQRTTSLWRGDQGNGVNVDVDKGMNLLFQTKQAGYKLESRNYAAFAENHNIPHKQLTFAFWSRIGARGWDGSIGSASTVYWTQ